MILDRASQPAFGTKYLPRRLSGLGMALMLSLAISEDWIAKLSRARLAWSDSNAPLREQVENYKNQFGALIDTPLPKNVPDDEYQAYKAKADALLLEAAAWIGEHISPTARAQLLDRSDVQMVIFSNAAHDRHNRLLVDLQ
jgi:hypothetical protein